KQDIEINEQEAQSSRSQAQSQKTRRSSRTQKKIRKKTGRSFLPQNNNNAYLLMLRSLTDHVAGQDRLVNPPLERGRMFLQNFHDSTIPLNYRH
ncbi:hypothetical protein A1F97_11182, partial [Pyrenophora tritici-repentis]